MGKQCCLALYREKFYGESPNEVGTRVKSGILLVSASNISIMVASEHVLMR